MIARRRVGAVMECERAHTRESPAEAHRLDEPRIGARKRVPALSDADQAAIADCEPELLIEHARAAEIA